MLIIGGDFTRVGDITAHNIAAWDGQRWFALGPGLDAPVHALAVYNDSLIAGGEFTAAGSTQVLRVAAWNGANWSPMGAGLTAFAGSSSVRALALHDGFLVAGGELYVSPSYNVARWNGAAWQSMGAGVGSFTETVYALQTYDSDGPGPEPVKLWVGSDDPQGSLRYWNGTTFAKPQTVNQLAGPDGPVYALTVVNALGTNPTGGLVVGGDFYRIPVGIVSGVQQYLLADDVAMRVEQTGGVGTWQAMGSGAGDAIDNENVTALRAFNGDLYVGGRFTGVNANSVAASNIARWNGTQWFPFGGGSTSGPVYAMREVNSSLVVGGQFFSAGAVSVNNIARWDSIFGTWNTYQPPATTWAFTTFGSRLVAGGSFASSDLTTTASNSYNLVGWNGLDVTRFGRGLPDTVRALTSFTTSGPASSSVLVAGGDFLSAVGDAGVPVTVNHIARWTESIAAPASWSAMGDGFNSNVYALERFNGETVAGGLFTASGSTSTPYLARWTGNPASWQPFGAIGLNNYVYALKTYFTNNGADQHLVIGGAFSGTTQSPPLTANRILQLTQTILGGTWVSLGEGFNGSVYAIERYGNGQQARTYAAGAFTHTSSGGTQLNRIARFTGNPATWQPVGTGVGFNNYVFALKSAGGYLYAAGAFTSVDGIAANRVARWNGSVWSAVPGGPGDGEVDALAAFGSELIAGGSFTEVLPPLFQSEVAGTARLLQTGAPWIVQQPASVSTTCADDAAFSVEIAYVYSPATYQWSKDGIALVNGPTGHGSTISGAQSPDLLIASARGQDAGAYDCVVTNSCGSVTSTAATLTVNGTCCVADIAPIGALDGQVNVADLLAVITAWGTCANCASCPADIAPAVHDCQVNVADLLTVITNWGPCP